MENGKTPDVFFLDVPIKSSSSKLTKLTNLLNLQFSSGIPIPRGSGYVKKVTCWNDTSETRDGDPMVVNQQLIVMVIDWMGNINPGWK
jgi:hypothetical protein